MRPHIRLGDVVVNWLEEDNYLQLNEDQFRELNEIRRDMISLTVQVYARRNEPSIIKVPECAEQRPESPARLPLPALEDEWLEPFKRLKALYEECGLEPGEAMDNVRATNNRVIDAYERAFWARYREGTNVASMN